MIKLETAYVLKETDKAVQLYVLVETGLYTNPYQAYVEWFPKSQIMIDHENKFMMDDEMRPTIYVKKWMLEEKGLLTLVS